MENLLEEEQQQAKSKWTGGRNGSKKKKKAQQAQVDNRHSSIENNVSDNQLEDLVVKAKKKKKKPTGVESRQNISSVSTQSDQQFNNPEGVGATKKKKKSGQTQQKESPRQSSEGQEHHSFDEQATRQELSLEKTNIGKLDQKHVKSSGNFYETTTTRQSNDSNSNSSVTLASSNNVNDDTLYKSKAAHLLQLSQSKSVDLKNTKKFQGSTETNSASTHKSKNSTPLTRSEQKNYQIFHSHSHQYV